MVKEVLLAQYDNQASNANIMSQLEAEAYGEACIDQRLVTAIGAILFDGYVSCEVVRVKEVQTRPATPSQGQIIALCEKLDIKHRRLRKWEKQHGAV